MHWRWSLLIPLMVLLTSSDSFATSIGLKSFSLDATTINFDDLAGGISVETGEIVTTQYASLGVTFVNPDYTSRANSSLATQLEGQSDPNILFVRQNGPNPFGDPQQIFFSSPMFRVGTFFETSEDATITMSAFSPTGVFLESVTLTGTFDAPDFLTGFIGLEEAGGIGRIELFSRANFPGAANFNFGIDDLRFEPVPEPNTLALFALGFVGAILRRRCVAG